MEDDVFPMPIGDYLKIHTQQELAAKLGVGQTAVCKMQARNVWICRRRDGSVYAYEIRKLGKDDKAA